MPHRYPCTDGQMIGDRTPFQTGAGQYVGTQLDWASVAERVAAENINGNSQLPDNLEVEGAWVKLANVSSTVFGQGAG